MNGQVKTITPNVAELMLRTNENNRPLSQRKVREYAHDMRNGNWTLTHQGILVGRGGKLIDGQHRLRACIEAGVPFTTLVIEDSDLESPMRLPIDVGLKRRPHEITGLDKRLTSPASQLAQMALQRMPTVQESRFWAKWIEPECEAIYEASGRTIKRYWSAAPMVSGLVLALKMYPRHKTQILRDYANLLHNKPTELSPIALAHYRQWADGRVRTHSKYEQVARAFLTFTPSNRNNTRIHCNSATVEAVRQHIIDLVQAEQAEEAAA